MLGGPPADVAPERLFRLLLQRPRPTAPLAWHSAGLRAQALTALEEQACYDAAAGLESPEEIRSVASCALVAAAVVRENGEPAFAGPAAVASRSGVHMDALAAEARTALARISPSYLRSDVEAWTSALKLGAKHVTNMAVVRALGSCVDISFGYGVRATVERPDRFFGVPQSALTDGQWMAFRAARVVLVEAQNKA